MRKKACRFTRSYTWTAKKNRGKLNLKKYTNNIYEAVSAVLPSDYNTFVSVGRDDFVIDTAKPIFREQAQQIGRKLAKTKAIGRLCIRRKYKDDNISNQIFKGTDISE